MLKIAVLVASYNRVSTTLRGLESMFEAARRQEVAELSVFLLDDASPDHTGAIVQRRFPAVHVLEGTGKLFWNHGMRKAYDAARHCGTSFDAYLLFNDDVVLMPNALERMFKTYIALNCKIPSVVTCPMKSLKTDDVTYFGFRIQPTHRNPLHLARVLPDGTIRECDTFHGNCVLVPGREMEAVGGLDPRFRHFHGDTDLGLSLRERGCKTYLMPEPLGYCDRDPEPPPDPSLFVRLWQVFTPPRSYFDDIQPSLKRLPWKPAMLVAFFRLRHRLANAFRSSRPI